MIGISQTRTTIFSREQQWPSLFAGGASIGGPLKTTQQGEGVLLDIAPHAAGSRFIVQGETKYRHSAEIFTYGNFEMSFTFARRSPCGPAQTQLGQLMGYGRILNC